LTDICDISAGIVWVREAGTRSMQSSAYLSMRLPELLYIGRRSATAMMKATGPRAEPWMTLELILAELDTVPLNLEGPTM